MKNHQDLLVDLPRGQRLEIESGAPIRTPMMPAAVTRVGRFALLGRVTKMAYVVLRYLADTWFDRITKRDSPRRRAVRLREALESQGGAWIKIGQQLSIRQDIFSPVVCDELSSLLDRSTRVIELDDVIRAVEKQTDRQLGEVFRHFDPEPIGSASIACVYLAILKDGSKVAVKVRRPGIAKRFMADLETLDRTLRLLEYTTLLRPGISRNLRTEMRKIFTEELDFRVEARYQELLRRAYRNRKKLAVTAPKVYHDLSGEKVMVSDFVSGFLLTDIIAAVERDEKRILSDLSELGIHPSSIAKRIIRTSFYTMLECPLYHGDPHPSNIVVQPKGRLVMIDFGACGVLSQTERDLLRQFHYYHSLDDVAGMVRATLGLMEPLPHVDIDRFSKELEQVCWELVYGIKSKHAEWWERSSIRFWLGLLKLVRKYRFPLPPNLMRMVRATLQYDTVAARVYPEIDVFREFRKYDKSANKRIRKRFFKRLHRQLVCGPDASNFARLEQVLETSNVLFFRIRKLLADPPFRFAAQAEKLYDLVGIGLKWFGTNIVVVLAAVGIAVVVHPDHLGVFRTAFDLGRSVFDPGAPGMLEADPVLSTIYILWAISVFVVTLTYGRRFFWRLGDREIGARQSA